MPSQQRPRIEMPADFYDTLEIMALANGGIGAGSDVENFKINELDVFASGKKCKCAHGPFSGLAIQNGLVKSKYSENYPNGKVDWREPFIDVDEEFNKYITRSLNDKAVGLINQRKYNFPVKVSAANFIIGFTDSPNTVEERDRWNTLSERVSWAKYKKELNIIRVPNPWEGSDLFGFEFYTQENFEDAKV